MPTPNLIPGTTLPFTLLHHTGIPNSHFDLLLQLPTQEKLLTWQIPSHPNTWPTTPPLATRIADHRPIYMTYEGPLSQNRGQVAHLTHGTATILSSTQSTLQIELTLPTQELKITLSLPIAISSDKESGAGLPGVLLDYGVLPSYPKTRKFVLWASAITFFGPFLLGQIISHVIPIPPSFSMEERAIAVAAAISLPIFVGCACCVCMVDIMWEKKVGWLPWAMVWTSLIFNLLLLGIVLTCVMMTLDLFSLP